MKADRGNLEEVTISATINVTINHRLKIKQEIIYAFILTTNALAVLIKPYKAN